MKPFGTLYRFELSNMFRRPYVPLLLVLMIAATVFLNVWPLMQQEHVVYVDEGGSLIFDTVSHYEAIQLERRFAQEDTGTKLDNEAIETMREMTFYYQKVEDPDDPPTFLLLNHNLVSDGLMDLGINPIYEHFDDPAKFAYDHMEKMQDREYQNQFLTQAEIQYWEQERSQLELPLTLGYAKGYGSILSLSYWLNLMVLAFVFLSLCGSFSDDHLCRTWPILTSTKHGHRPLALARLAAGESVAGGSILLLFAITAAIQFSVYGTQGAQTPIQLTRMPYLQIEDSNIYLCRSSRVMDAGQAVLVTMGTSLLIILLAGALSMLLSKLFRRAIPALALPLGLMVYALVIAPPVYSNNRIAAQLWSYLPTQRLSQTFLLDARLVSLGGIQLDCISAGFLLYGGLTLLSLAGCFWLYQRHAAARV